MTNEEKANEIGCKHRIRYEDNNFNIVGISTSECIESALEMAKWKDEQFKEEKQELLGLVQMLPVDSHNQTIIEDLLGLLS